MLFTITWILLQNYACILSLLCSGGILSFSESLGKVLMVCIIYEHIHCFYSFLISFRLGSNAVLILIIFTLHTSLALYLIFIIFCIIFCWHLSRIMFRYCSKYEHSLTPNVLAKSLQLTIIRKVECMILLDIQKGCVKVQNGW